VGVVDFEVDPPHSPSSPSALPIKSIKRTKFYWGSTSEGVPSPLFVFEDPTTKTQPGNKTKSPEERVYWPYDGISIINREGKISQQLHDSPTAILVIGQVVAPLPSSVFLGVDILSFFLSHSLAYLISNPYDSPDLWEYRPISLPPSIVDQQTKRPLAYLKW
jgi:hypothetical protein